MAGEYVQHSQIATKESPAAQRATLEYLDSIINETIEQGRPASFSLIPTRGKQTICITAKVIG